MRKRKKMMIMVLMMIMRRREREEVWALRVKTWAVTWRWWGCVSPSSSTQQPACPISHHPSLSLMEYAGNIYSFIFMHCLAGYFGQVQILMILNGRSLSFNYYVFKNFPHYKVFISLILEKYCCRI